MTPDSDTYAHIAMNGLLWYVLIFGIPTAYLKGRDWLRRRHARAVDVNTHRSLYTQGARR